MLPKNKFDTQRCPWNHAIECRHGDRDKSNKNWTQHGDCVHCGWNPDEEARRKEELFNG